MQVNVYVPKDKEYLLEELARQAEQTGRSKNELILEGMARQVAAARIPEYRTYELGAGRIDRGDLYGNRTG